MADQMTTTGSVGGGRKDPVDAVAQKYDELRQAMIDAGEDPGQVDAKLSMVRPPTSSIVGNLADVQRMGAIAVTGTMPTPPGQDDLQTSNLTDAFVEPQPQTVDGEPPTDGASTSSTPSDTPTAATAPTGTDYESMTKADLQAVLDARGVDYHSTATKADLVVLAQA